MNQIQFFLQNLCFENLPKPVLDQAVRCLYDLIGTAVAGSQTQLSAIIHRHVGQHFSAPTRGPTARSLLGGFPLSVGGAALAGGMMIDSIDAHDGHRLTKGHVGCALLPTLIAVLEASDKKITGREFITLLVAGYEIGTRAGMALHATASDYHTSGAWNAVNCAAICAHLLGADTAQFEHAIGIAEYHGPRSQMMRGVDFPTMVKDGSGWGAMAGISAAFLALDGFTGAPALTVTAPEVSGIWSSLGSSWLIMDQYFKPYPCCRWIHPGIDAVLDLVQRHNIDPAAIQTITVSTFHQATRLYQGIPLTTEQAQYASIFPIAVAVVNRKVEAAHLDGEGLSDPAVLAICARTKMVEVDCYSAKFPAERWAHVTLQLQDGTQLESAPHASMGDQEQPLSDRSLQDKYSALTKSIWGEEKSQRVMTMISEIGGEGSDLSRFLNTLRD